MRQTPSTSSTRPLPPGTIRGNIRYPHQHSSAQVQEFSDKYQYLPEANPASRTHGNTSDLHQLRPQSVQHDPVQGFTSNPLIALNFQQEGTSIHAEDPSSHSYSLLHPGADPFPPPQTLEPQSRAREQESPILPPFKPIRPLISFPNQLRPATPKTPPYSTAPIRGGKTTCPGQPAISLRSRPPSDRIPRGFIHSEKHDPSK